MLVKLPPTHVWQVDEPVEEENVPAGQFWHVVLRNAPKRSEYLPAGHCLHCDTSCRFSTSLYVPLGQGNCRGSCVPFGQ